ncbi:putative porin [Sphingomonas sp.]|jgi:hypothetical protein|uniref:putative porin n=1 Tax=Sphingomonas sp. TaxID=28214 RepID=UPI002ED9A4FE
MACRVARNALGIGLALAMLAVAGEAQAQQAPTVEEIRARIAMIESDSEARIATVRADTAAQIAELRARLDQISPPVPGAPLAAATQPPAKTSASAPVQMAATAPKTNPLQFSGDVRVRYEQNFGDNRRDRGRGVVRGRLKAIYSFDQTFSVGARLVTGDPDDPNSADITLTQFDDDLVVGLDQLYARVHLGALDLYGGKFDNPFVRTDLVWDGDVNPQGLAAIVTQPLGSSFKASARALHFLIDEAPAARDSTMTGGQLVFSGKLAPQWLAEFAASYYDYTLPALAGADAGDFRSNLLTPSGRYRSDFNLLDVVGSITYAGLGADLPVRIVGDYVHNYGAAVADDHGFGADIFIGRASQPGDWRVQYGYAEMGVDAVFAAFSHDNTDLATNYVQHTGALDYVPAPHILLTATYYHYRLKNPLYVGPIAAGAWANRLRLNLVYSF